MIAPERGAAPGDVVMGPLELHYRRLMRVYPVAYRRAHGADMLGTMLADAGPEQRRPRLGDAVNVVFHGLRLRLGRCPRGGLFDTGWADACTLLGPLAALVLLATGLPILLRLPPTLVTPPIDTHTNIGFAVLMRELQTVGWAGAALAGLVRLRRTAAVLGWVALLIEVAPLPRLFETTPVQVIQGLWRPALGIIAAVALTSAGARGVVAVFGRWRLVTFLAALTVIDVVAARSSLGRLMEGPNEVQMFYEFYPARLLGLTNSSFSITSSTLTGMYLMMLGFAGSLLALAVAVLTVPGRIRRRLLAAAAPVVTLVVLIDRGFAGWAVSNDHMGHSIPLTPAQWIALIGLPLLTLALGLWWVHRRDELLRLAALGASAERPEPPATTV
jgi:hypothetical protein